MTAIVNEARCSGCGDCMTVCPVDAITMALGKAEIDPDECIGCGACIDECRRGAISMQD
ncbi:MAG: coenzyme hydrogenase subunit gamma [Clostridiales bacterium]|jgi:ferredoxin|nr:coenzyme hydrogenase subunit gamma [Clostridiales bacterium]